MAGAVAPYPLLILTKPQSHKEALVKHLIFVASCLRAELLRGATRREKTSAPPRLRVNQLITGAA